jgi:hypothetical protein
MYAGTRVGLNSAGFGIEEGAHVENIDAVKLETLETSRLLDTSEGCDRPLSPPKRDGAASENVRGER